MIASGSSERGLSLVTITESASWRATRSHLGALRPVAVAAGAEHDRQAAHRAHVPRGAPLEGVRLVRVVDDDGEARPSSIASKRPANARNGGDPRGDRILVDVEEQRGSHGAEHVLDVEHPGQPGRDLDPRRGEGRAGAQLEAVRAHPPPGGART